MKPHPTDLETFQRIYGDSEETITEVQRQIVCTKYPYPTELVNEWAKLSCPAWERSSFLRFLNRKKYQIAATNFYKSYGHLECMRLYRKGYCSVNTYPWPFRDEDFADWADGDSSNPYNLVFDQSGCIIRHPTSYCAWKIYEATGSWPKQTSSTRYKSYDWENFLFEAGYKYACYPDVIKSSKTSFVGINPSDGQFGIVVWLEVILDTFSALVSTYRNNNYSLEKVDIDDFVWIKIG